MHTIALPRDRAAVSDYSYAEIPVLQNVETKTDRASWDYLFGTISIWLSVYNGDSDFSVSRTVNGKHQSKRAVHSANDSVSAVYKKLNSIIWADSETPESVCIHVGDEIDTWHRPEIILRMATDGRIFLGYNQASFSIETITRLSGHLVRIVSPENSELAVNQLSILSKREYAQVVFDFNSTSRATNGLDPISCLEQRLLQNPKNTAVVDASGEYSYEAVNDVMSSVSSELQLRDSKHRVVGVYMTRSLYSITSMLGVWHAGSVWLPLSLDYPDSMLEHMCSQNEITCILSTSDVDLPESLQCYEKIDVDSLAKTDFDCDRVNYSPDDSAAVMYTSGSTGLPNGVLHSHRALQNRFDWWLSSYPSNESEVFCNRTALTFIPSLWESVSGVMSNRPVVVVSDAIAKNPSRLLSEISKHRCTRVALLPSFLKLILMSEKDAGQQLGSLRYLITAGEPVDIDLVKLLQNLVRDLVVINDYGCTETNGVLSSDSQSISSDAEFLPAGKPISNCQAYVLGKNQQVLPIGVIGELYIAGLAVSQRYVENSELTDSRYLWLQIEGKSGLREWVRVFRTSDCARWASSGQMEVLGRRDNVVKIRGIRVELESVEKALSHIDEISEVAAGTIKDDHGRTKLAVWIVSAKSSTRLSPSILRAHLLSTLHESAVPSVIQFVEALPKTSNGKLARAELGSLVPVPDIVTTQSIGNFSEHEVVVQVVSCLAEILSTDVKLIEPDTEFQLQGLESASAVEFVQLLSDGIGRAVPVTAVYEASTPNLLAQKLCSNDDVVINKSQDCTDECKIAVIGMACNFPGAKDVGQYWDLLKSGQNKVSEVPEERWNWRDFDGPNSVGSTISSKWGAFLDNVDQFDPVFFNISRKEACLMSPEQRLLLQSAWNAISDAGLTESTVKGQPIGMFVGARGSDYHEHISEAGITPNAATLIGNDNAILSARTSYYFNLTGPAVTVDTACSSSLVSIHLACQSISRGECHLAVAAGVSVVTSPTQYICNTNAGMLSPDGQCKTFDKNANGFVQGEGCGVVVLKPLEAAIKDGDRIYAVVSSSGVNQDGKTNGITAPSGDSQRKLIQSVYESSSKSPADIGLMEAHGTGTKLGDPIEFSALSDVHRKWTDNKNYCAIGSVKTNIGHLIAAAGIAGFIKSTLAIHNAYIPPTLNYTECNEHIDLDNSPFYIPTEGGEWRVEASSTGPASRMAAVSAFGFSGTNCHIVLEESPADFADTVQKYQPESILIESDPLFFLLSAKTDLSLKKYAKELLHYVRETKDDMHDIAGSLYQRFNTFDHRVLILADAVGELTDALQSLSEGVDHDAVISTCEIRKEDSSQKYQKFGNMLIDEITSKECVVDSEWRIALGHLFSLGYVPKNFKLSVDDDRAEAQPWNLVQLPNYQFDNVRCWVDSLKDQKASVPRDHPKAVDSNSSLITFEVPKERFLDHKVGSEVWMPFSAQLVCLLSSMDKSSDQYVCINNWKLVRPVVLGRGYEELKLETTKSSPNERSEFSFYNAEYEISSGNISFDEISVKLPQKIEPSQLFDALDSADLKLSKQEFYTRCKNNGVHYGSVYQRVAKASIDKNTAIALVGLPDEINANGTQSQEAMFDGALQVLNVLTPENECWVPVEFRRLILNTWLPERVAVMASLSEIKNRHERFARLSIFDLNGKLLVAIGGLVLKRVSNTEKKVSKSTKTQLVESVSALPKLIEPQRITDSVPKLCCWERRYFDEPMSNRSLPKSLDIAVLPGNHIKLPTGCNAVFTDIDSVSSVSGVKYCLWRPSETDSEELIEKFILQCAVLASTAKRIRLLISVEPESTATAMLASSARCVVREFPKVEICVVEHHSDAYFPVDEFFSEKTGWVARRQGIRTELAWVDSENIDVDDTSAVSDVGDSVCLVTGATGGIGRQLVEWLVVSGATKVALTGRREKTAALENWLKEISRDGTELVYFQSQIENIDSCKQLYKKIHNRFGAINRIYYCAGTTADTLVINKNKNQIKKVFAAKKSGLNNLDLIHDDGALDQLVIFSSISCVVGTAGQSDYAAVNAWMTDFSEKRNQRSDRKGHAIAIHWGLWDGGGMMPSSKEIQNLALNKGMHPLPPKTGFDSMARLADNKVEVAAVVYGDYQKLNQWVNESTTVQYSSAVGD